MTDSNTGKQSDLKVGNVYRPPFQLRSLPIRYRWEATRRHPYYQHWWKLVQRYYRNEPVESDAESLLRLAAVAILGGIGVSGTPPDPATEFRQLEEAELSPAWLSGAVHPISMRGLVAILITALPKETLEHVGRKLVEAVSDDKEGEPPRRIAALSELYVLDEPGLDPYPDEPIVSVNPAASGRQLEEDIARLLRQWKQERDLGDKRNRSDKFGDYLTVWDLREGWVDGEYDRSRATFSWHKRQTGCPEPTR